MNEKTGILIVEDDPDIASALERALRAQSFSVKHAADVQNALDILKGKDINAAIVDVMIGLESGLDLVRQARAKGLRKPIIMLSALADVDDRTKGIAAGADDYVVKPFSFDELFARLQVQLIREQNRPSGISLDESQSSVAFSDEKIVLTAREFQLMSMLVEQQGEPVSRWTIFDELWRADEAASENIVDVYIGYLRKKLAEFSSAQGPEIKTIRNKGFVLVVPD